MLVAVRNEAFFLAGRPGGLPHEKRRPLNARLIPDRATYKWE
jgi:hypothetical protein